MSCIGFTVYPRWEVWCSS